MSDTLFDLLYYDKLTVGDISTYKFSAKESSLTGSKYCKDVIDMSEKF